VLVSTVAAGVVTAVVYDVVGGLKRNDNKGGNPRCKASSSVSVKVVEQCEQRTCEDPDKRLGVLYTHYKTELRSYMIHR